MQISDIPSVILGIDPGFKRIGYGAISHAASKFSYLGAGMLRTPHETRNSPQDLANALDDVLEKYHPELCAIEKVYFGQNKTSVLGVSEIRGMLLLHLNMHHIPVIELTPLEVKSMVCGYGRADKSAVRKIITSTFPEATPIKSKDAIDGIAIALAGFYKQRNAERIARA